MRIIIRLVKCAAVFGVLACLSAGLWLAPSLYTVSGLDLDEPYREFAGSGPTFIDRNGIRLNSPPRWLRLTDLPPQHIALLLVREDERFLKRRGPIDARAILRAGWACLSRRSQGASTLEMQVARCAYQLPGGSYTKNFKRKIIEVALAFRLSRRFSKEQILELYLNRVSVAGCRGLREAASRHFGVEPKDLRAEQILWLYATLPSPSKRADHTSAPVLLKKALEHLRQQERLEPEVRLSNQPALGFATSPTRPGDMPVAWEAEFNRALRNAAGHNLPVANLVANLTIDFRLQTNLQRIVTRQIQTLAQHLSPAERTQLDAGLVVVANGTAEVLAIIPSANEGRWYSNASQALRAPGSAFKTFTLASAVETGIATLDSLVLDTPLAAGEIPSAPKYSPRNCDRQFRGPITLLRAFADSRNLPFVRLGEQCREPLRRILPLMGLSALRAGEPSQFLGSNGVSVLAMAGAYGAFGNDGVFVPHTMVRQVRNSSPGTVFFSATAKPQRIVSSETSAAVRRAMREVVRTGTAAHLGRLGLPGGAKTGTTSDSRDLWTCYIEDRFTLCVWVGRRDNKPLWSRASSATIQPLAAEAIQAVRESSRGN